MHGTEAPPTVKVRSRSKLFVATALMLLLVLAAFIPPFINLGKYRHSITSSISAALGRPVEVGAMQLRLLPVPAIDMTDLTVEEDPAFGFEPSLHANDVVAALRLRSLWRGRLEVSRISLDEASLNLVRNDAGQWNIATVLLRASQIPNAATGERHAGAAVRFPYIEATDARINFKDGAEKRPFSLMNAKFAMWQASGGEWQLRLEAQPVRTDLALQLSDAGDVTLEGSLRRAADIRDMPMKFDAEWSGAQLGQVSRLLFGVDKGWRGDLDVTTSIVGNASDLALKTRVQIGSLRRQEFQPVSPMDVDAKCTSRYQHPQRLLGEIQCFLPEGDGHLLLTGSLQGGAARSADLTLEINHVPAQLPVTLLALMRPHAANVKATGTMNGNFHLVRSEQKSLTGETTVTGVTVTYPGGTLTLPTLHVVTQIPPVLKKGKRVARPARVAIPDHESVTLETFAVPLGESEPLMVDAQVDRAGFVVHLTGAAALDRLTAAGGSFGFLGHAMASVSGKGRADLNTSTTGNWIAPLSGVDLTTTGTVRVQGAQLRPSFLQAPVEIASAELNLTPAAYSWENVAFHYQGLAMHGSLAVPVNCEAPAACFGTFTLQPGDVDAATLELALAGKRPGFFGQMLADLGEAHNAAWPPLHGTVQWGTLSVGRLALHIASAAVGVNGTELTLRSLDAATLGGTVHATGTMALVNGTPQWQLDVNLHGVKAAEAGALFKEHWGAGTANGDARLHLSGWHAEDLAASAAGSFRLTWLNGGLAGGAVPLARFDRWTANGTISNSALILTDGGVTRAGVTTPVRGTVGFDRRLNLTVEAKKNAVQVGGTLARPVVGK
ncbi:MAG: AsmA family protein [Acidobacteriaceae bacterium]